MVADRSCPGSGAIREPRPEFIDCPDCGREVEIWTDELKATCPGCGSKVFRAQQASCIDWCPHARECVGPEVYQRLRPGIEEDVASTGTALDVIKREHDRILDNIGLLRAAGLCLKMGALAPQSAVGEKGIEHLSQVLDFIGSDVRLHFRREEEVLFPALEKYLGTGQSPTRPLVEEHARVWQRYDRLREKMAVSPEGGAKLADATPAEVQDLSSHLEHFLREHIKKENESLLTLSSSLLGDKELEEISGQWKLVNLPADDRVKA